MKLFLDDERAMPTDFTGDDDWTTTSIQAINRLHVRKEWGVVYDEISLDHDLGGDDTGMKVLEWMIANDYWPRVLTIHTANPAARENMLRAANAEAPDWVAIYLRYW